MIPSIVEGKDVRNFNVFFASRCLDVIATPAMMVF